MDGLYIVKANILGCNLIKQDTINIHFEKPILFDLGNDTFYCNDFSRILSTSIQNTIWSTSEVDSSIKITKAGTYWATISNRCFKVVDTINIGDGKFNFDLGDEIQLCKNSIEIGIQDLDYKRYLWNTGDTTPFISINNPAVYSLLITNNKNCDYLDSIKVVNDCLNECVLPDAFSPNEDDINDFYFPKFDNNEISIVRFNVYNRLGNLVFEGNNNNYKWNGKFKGEKLLSDIYTWYLEYKLENNIIIKKGFVLLLY
jgi:gliding motility-associated-like protein